MFNVPIILASTSPRRKHLMEQVQLRCEIREPDADETLKRGEEPEKFVARLARAKAESVMMECLWEYGAAMIIAADTTVVAPNGKTILNKPRDEAEARKMLKMLQGKTHTVLTGYTILAVAREMNPVRVSRVVRSKVKMRPLSKEAIDRYIATGESMDKAGSYAAQGFGMALVESISGSYTNVVGLPISHLLMDLEKKFGIELFEQVRNAN